MVGPILKRYLTNLISKIAEAGYAGTLLIMQSNGRALISGPATTADLAASTLLSGPAAAPVAGLAYMAVHHEDSFITMDMGGTSFDAALGEARRALDHHACERRTDGAGIAHDGDHYDRRRGWFGRLD